jgi:hypothetical protein
VGRRGLDAVVQQHASLVSSLVSDVELHLSGSALVSGLDADDVDLVGLVADVPKAAALLRAVYPPLYEEQWSDDWAAFRSPGSPQVDLVLTTRGSKWDAHHRLAWDLLQRDGVLLAEYHAMKQERTRYAERKREFFERVVRLLRGSSDGAA